MKHALHVLVASLLVAGALSGTAALILVPLAHDLERPELRDESRAPSSTTTTARVLIPPMSAAVPATTVAPGSLSEANDQGDPTFVPPAPRDKSRASTTSTAAPSTVPATRAPGNGQRWEVSSTVYCLTGTTASGDQTGPGIVAVHSSRFAELNGTRWRVIEGPDEIVGQTFTVRDKGPGAEFDVWMGDRPDCPTWGRYTYGRQRAVVVPA